MEIELARINDELERRVEEYTAELLNLCLQLSLGKLKADIDIHSFKNLE